LYPIEQFTTLVICQGSQFCHEPFIKILIQSGLGKINYVYKTLEKFLSQLNLDMNSHFITQPRLYLVLAELRIGVVGSENVKIHRAIECFS